jgi:hypothetical protein
MTEVKQFENNQLNGEIQRGVLEAFVNAIESEVKGRETLA